MTPTLYVLGAGMVHIVLSIRTWEVVCVCGERFTEACYTTIVSDREVCRRCRRSSPDRRVRVRDPLADLADQFGKMQRKIVRDAPPGTFPFPIVEEQIPQEQSK